RRDEEAQAAAEQEAQRREEEAQRRADEEARAAAEEEAQREGEAQREETRAAVVEENQHEATPPLAPRTPRQFRPTGRAPAPPQPGSRSPNAERGTRDRAMPLEVRLVFEKAGFCRVSLLPRRGAGMPSELAVEGSGSPPELLALQEEWYQDVILSDIGRLMK